MLGILPELWFPSLATGSTLPELSSCGKVGSVPKDGVLAGDDVLPIVSELGLRGTVNIKIS